nr:hypothetical protein [Tanacetum cinerariifolium]
MVAILEKGEYNIDFHPMVDFIAASPLRIETTAEGTHILATVDDIQRTASESSLRRNIKLRDEDGIISLLDTELFENLTLIGRARIAQSSALSTIADEPASLVRDVSEGEARPTDSGFIADQDRATIAKSSSLPYDSAPRVTSPVAAEGSMQPNITEFKALCTSLQRQYSELLAKFQAQEVEIRKLKDRVKVLEDREGVAATQSGDDAPIKGRSIDEGEATTERISDDSEELARVLTSMDAATDLAGGIDVPTGSGFIPTVGPPVCDVPTGSDDVPTASPVFATATVIDAQVARELEEQQEREDKRMTEQIARDAEVARIHAEEELQGMIDSLDGTNETIAKYIQEYQEFASELPLERRIELIKWKLYNLCGVHQVTAKDKDIFMLVEKDYPLRKGLAIVMISYKLQVETYSKMANELVLKIYKIASTPRQQGD